MSVAQVYDFDGIFEPPIAKLFLAAGVIAYASQGRLNDDGTFNPQPNFQKDRPRVEIVFTRGPGAKRWTLPTNPNPNIPLANQARESAWKANLAITALTEAGGVTHFKFLAQVRNICATLPAALDGLTLATHCINGPIVDLGETHRYNQQEGYYATILNYSFDFSVQNTTWALLTQP